MEETKSGSYQERVRLFIDWEQRNPEYLLTLAAYAREGRLTPQIIDGHVPQLTGQEWMYFQICSMLCAVEEHQRRIEQEALNNASQQPSKGRKSGTRSRKGSNPDVRSGGSEGSTV